MKVEDVDNFGNPVELKEKEYNERFDGTGGYCWYLDSINGERDFSKGEQQIHILAWDNHGNKTEDTLTLIVE